MSDIDTVVVDSLKALDPEWPIREADIVDAFSHFRFVPWHSRAGGGAVHSIKSRHLRGHSITSSARNTIDGGTVRAGALAVLAFSAVTVPIGKLPSPGSEPERVFTSSQPAIADEILGIERRCFTASLRGARTRSSRERRAHAGIDIVITEGLL